MPYFSKVRKLNEHVASMRPISNSFHVPAQAPHEIGRIASREIAWALNT